MANDRVDGPDVDHLFEVPADSLEAVRRDAERYRWLREECVQIDSLNQTVIWEGKRFVGTATWHSTQTLDAAIDAAIASQKGA